MADELNEKVNSKRPMDILLVEDNKVDIKIAIRAFQKAQLKNNVYIVNDGQEAIDFIRHQGKYQDKEKFPKPDLILLDIKMPKVDGFEVLKTIKSDLQYNFIPVIMLTSSKNEEDIVKSYQFGACSFVQKPVDYEEFVKIINGLNDYWRLISKLPK